MARRRRKRVYTRRRRPMARRYYRKARRIYRGGGGFKPIIDGAIAGAGGQFAGKFLGGFGQPAADIAVGMFMKNKTLKTIGGRGLGMMLSGGLVGNGGNGGVR